ncbi:hypothetical protein GUJ93_ZPchr0011g27755 [Zizania palustris]|uniref:Uncharacterized protein n=1 Tax=Zizania palustris TaxID=103762 RepID=A0A8J5WI72_ZIZPA|nr:hypothetical protein GUJ93_ZPchr0011g27755 [Zizania palustris]
MKIEKLDYCFLRNTFAPYPCFVTVCVLQGQTSALHDDRVKACSEAPLARCKMLLHMSAAAVAAEHFPPCSQSRQKCCADVCSLVTTSLLLAPLNSLQSMGSATCQISGPMRKSCCLPASKLQREHRLQSTANEDHACRSSP